MRIYLPLTTQDRPALESGGGRIGLMPGRTAWAVTAEARTDRPDQDEEGLEYDALQDAIHIALSEGAESQRALVIAADVPDIAVTPETEDGGAFGISLRDEVSARVASFHVTELDAAAAAADDTDPALLWFDATEGTAALAYLGGGPAA